MGVSTVKLFYDCSNFICSAVKRMIEHNPENAKISNEYGYNLLHTGALYGRKDIVSLAIEKVRFDIPGMKSNLTLCCILL